MGKRRLAIAMSDDDDDDTPPPPKAAEEEEAVAIPVGDAVRVSGKGIGRKNHYQAFEMDGVRYQLEDSVLLTPEEIDQKPYVAIIKDISLKLSGESLMVTRQWFYRPEEAEKKGGGNWQSNNTRELFYSFYRDDIPAESVAHKCVVHFIPLNKQIPNRKLHPGFIVQKVYDPEQRRLFKLTDKDFEDSKQEEIDVLVNKTIARIGDLPDIERDDTHTEQEDHLKSKRLLERLNISNLDVSRDDDITTRSGQSLKMETPGSVTNSEYYTLLVNFKALTGEPSRDKWLDRLLQGMQFICRHSEPGQSDKGGSDAQNSSSKGANGSPEKSASDRGNYVWPDDVIRGIVTLEKAAHEALSSDHTKYNQKMRQLLFNLKNNSVLATRLLKGELEPSTILSMSPTELKEGLTSEELASKQPEESAHIQIEMTDARCRRCSEKKVGLTDIIRAGRRDRYQLECTACGTSWYAFRDEVSRLTIETPNKKNVGTAPLATTKFENIEKNLVSLRESDRSADEIFKKTTEAYMPVLQTQRSSKKTNNA